MKTLRLVSTPTRNRRLNEILGMVVLVSAGLLLLALASYTPTDPSFDTVGQYVKGRPAHNWTGMVGAYLADAMLQLIGVAAFFLPLVLGRLGICWMRSRPAGSPLAKTIGLGMWVVFGPAAIALLPGEMMWRGSLPVEGTTGRLLADLLVHYLNLPGAAIVLTLMVAVSLYLATTFTFNTAREWATIRFGFVQRLWEWWSQRRSRRAGAEVDLEEAYGSKREQADARARRARELAEAAERRRLEPEPESTTLLGGLFGWLSRKKKVQPISISPEEVAVGHHTSIFEAMPRTLVDAPPVTAFSTAVAAAAPFAEVLAKAAAPVHALDDESNFRDFAGAEDGREPVSMKAPAPMRVPKKVAEEPRAPFAPVPAASQPLHTLPDNISFGKRADADIKPVTIVPKSVRGYKLPPSSLLYRSEEHAVVREDALREEARVLVEKSAEFGVDGQVTQINPGPVVTTFEFKPEAGVKVARITGLADDLCLAMAAESILIERMPGKSTVGIQVPNHERETIWLRDVVECESFAQSKSRLAIALGKDINGRIVTADLASMPHVLIAGSTGSGKSVAINAMIMSVLFKSTPEQVRMILVDPKRVELGMYEGIPHLFTPIITEAKLAANALRNAVREMERRLKLLAANHVRNIDQFNKLFDHGSEYLFEDVNQEPLPYIIIIIDELADLMMLDRANVEESITRLAQMARAVGIHLVLATQRPSVDVITGLIKANVPTRMSFRLATKVDSRTIIDSNGAESLLGRGDMLYLPPGTSRVQRVHAPFVTEKEISAVTAFWRAQGEAEYVHGFLEGPKEDNGTGKDGDGGVDGDNNDELYDDAVRLVFEFGKASTSLLQRRLRIGYGRAAHLIDMMYNDGLVGPADGSKPREILKSPNWISEVDAAIR
ncbi:DNA translocase FtsK [Tunturiibacter gelidoferens]|uniref:S-DNA-T family DNA segregation ATPase FtsK/SpoIIIE n=2 Tax=Tunturiibacter TaxID=3154218 RepID=A0A7Y9NPR7_9BACT|nr:DNA translocase FtsK [Edaphobacter lichenicola]MBB5341917.1 S-DNA-T family DNA segregation ATPase FtsK/SpoIIIE [Edaphobacter lichenicola]NYF53298.1 S-DNA-T family DNA segregation ATPase FtsK/SpoIIIE [Edaphobacter lichenicola]